MVRRAADTPGDFFSNPTAREAGFTDNFWHHAYQLYLDAVRRDPSPSLDKFDVARTVRVPFRQGHVDVLVRVNPDPREFRVMRFTAFPAADDRPDPRQVSRWYWQEGPEQETRAALGEGALLDSSHRW